MKFKHFGMVLITMAALKVPGAGVFDASPGTNTLAVVRDAVRAWRVAGHADRAAVIRLAPGTYALTEPLGLTAADSRVTWEARSPGRTVITGGERITGFTMDAGGRWHAAVRRCFEQLYVNGERAQRAQAPGAGFFPIRAVQQAGAPHGQAWLTMQVTAEALAALPAEADALTNVEVEVFHNWDTSRYRVARCDRAAGSLTVLGQPMSASNPWTAKSWFRLENARQWVTRPGSWFWDPSGELIYFPRPGERPESTEVVAPVVEHWLQVQGAQDVHFTGLRFYHAAWTLPPGGDPPVQAAARLGAAIELDDATGVTFDRVEIAHTGNYGIWFRQGCRDCRLEHAALVDLGGGGVRIGEVQLREEPERQTGGVVVDDSIIRGGGRNHPSAVGIWIGQSANNRITHNDISDLFYTGISAGWTWGYGRSQATNNYIGYNRIHNIGQGVLSDMGGIYTLGVSSGSAEVGNVIYDVRARDYGGWGIYPDEGSSGWRIESNLVWHCTCVNPAMGGAFHQHYGETNRIANNVLAFSSGPPLQATRVEDHDSFSLEHNLILSSNTPFFKGPWTQLHAASGSNCFVALGDTVKLFPTGDLASWQAAGHEAGSCLTNLTVRGEWPDITLPRHSPAEAVGFVWFDPRQAGADWRWKHPGGKLP